MKLGKLDLANFPPKGERKRGGVQKKKKSISSKSCSLTLPKPKKKILCGKEPEFSVLFFTTLPLEIM